MSEKKFNKQQQEVINFKEGHCLALAGAGSGKTACVIERIKKIVDSGVSQRDILAISFTKDSANELVKRLGKKYSDVEAKTFHSLCLRYLREFQSESKDIFSRDWIFDKYMQEKFGYSFRVPDALSWISFQKNNGYRENSKTFAQKDVDMSEAVLRQAYSHYQRYLYTNDMRDFDDMLLDFIDLANDNKDFYKYINKRYKYVMVDEHQDSNNVQQEILKILCGNGNLLAIGDGFQNLYSFRGSNMEIIINFVNDWEDARIIKLPTNYRSTKDIVNLSNEFLKQKFSDSILLNTVKAHNKKDGVIKINDGDVSRTIKELVDRDVNPNDIAVLYRSHYLSAEYEMGLRELEIPYHLVGQARSFFDRPEIEVAMGYIRLALDNTNTFAYQKVYNTPNRFLSKKFMNDALTKGGNLLDYRGYKPNEKRATTQLVNIIRNIDLNGKPSDAVKYIVENTGIKEHLLEKYEDGEDRIGALYALVKMANGYKSAKQFVFMFDKMKNEPPKKNGVTLMTAHASKGLEFKHVFVVEVNDEKFPNYRSTDEEERRLFYVAISRAIEGLYIYGYGIYVKECNAILENLKGESNKDVTEI